MEPTDIARQISHADDLMYIEKQQYYGRRLDNPGGYFANLSTELIDEIAEGAFLVYLQPKIDLQTGVLSGAEALVHHRNEHGVIESPGKFIPRYETEGIIRHLDFFVLETIC